MPFGDGPVDLQGKIKFTLPGSKYFILEKKKKMFFLQHVQFYVLINTYVNAYVYTLLFILLSSTNKESLSLVKRGAEELIKR